MGFIKDMRRLNVAMTRAKHQIICVGNLNAIAELQERGGNMELRGMASDAADRGEILHAPNPDALPPPPTYNKQQGKQKKSQKKSKKKKKK